MVYFCCASDPQEHHVHMVSWICLLIKSDLEFIWSQIVCCGFSEHTTKNMSESFLKNGFALLIDRWRIIQVASVLTLCSWSQTRILSKRSIFFVSDPEAVRNQIISCVSDQEPLLSNGCNVAAHGPTKFMSKWSRKCVCVSDPKETPFSN